MGLSLRLWMSCVCGISFPRRHTLLLRTPPLCASHTRTHPMCWQFQDDLEAYLRAHEFSSGHHLYVSNVEVLGLFGVTHALLHIAGHLVALATELRQLAHAIGVEM
jgi:hypothetical protein